MGVGNKVRMYDFGKKKLLAKCENRVRFSAFFLTLCERRAAGSHAEIY